ncbi:hypothetical protein PPERSA_01653 [Pseudocohnilembus persalinus]|uniref:PAS domain n=1 Tax=Pseudocohnilembus persalinus TaxID=266149 RepID=A0A0V0R0Q5_PSEPJ|nr:hypothetical protein PPERSA_01653 [Pseudocohnilembus persalinus]|eukprot:KRX08108.1 hypothetical protein PPERSA_01653 [Pseudocohnilembus persalinus]
MNHSQKCLGEQEQCICRNLLPQKKQLNLEINESQFFLEQYNQNKSIQFQEGDYFENENISKRSKISQQQLKQNKQVFLEGDEINLEVDEENQQDENVNIKNERKTPEKQKQQNKNYEKNINQQNNQLVQIEQRRITDQEDIQCTINVNEQIQQELNFEDLVQSLSKATQSHLDFWNELIDANPDSQRLYLIGEKININLQEVKSSFQLYGPESDCSIITVSGNKSSKNSVLKLNNDTTRIFGFLKNEMIGFNVNEKIMPFVFRDIHEELLQNFYETSKRKSIGKSKLAFPVNKDGYLIPSNQYINYLPNLQEGIQFIGFTKERFQYHIFPYDKQDLNDQKSQVYFIMYREDQEQNKIIGITQNVEEKFRIPLLMCQGNENDNFLQIKQFFPEFDNSEYQTQLFSEEGANLLFDTTFLKDVYISNNTKNQKNGEENSDFSSWQMMNQDGFVPQRYLVNVKFDYSFDYKNLHIKCIQFVVIDQLEDIDQENVQTSKVSFSEAGSISNQDDQKIQKNQNEHNSIQIKSENNYSNTLTESKIQTETENKSETETESSSETSENNSEISKKNSDEESECEKITQESEIFQDEFDDLNIKAMDIHSVMEIRKKLQKKQKSKKLVFLNYQVIGIIIVLVIVVIIQIFFKKYLQNNLNDGYNFMYSQFQTFTQIPDIIYSTRKLKNLANGYNNTYTDSQQINDQQLTLKSELTFFINEMYDNFLDNQQMYLENLEKFGSDSYLENLKVSLKYLNIFNAQNEMSLNFEQTQQKFILTSSALTNRSISYFDDNLNSDTQISQSADFLDIQDPNFLQMNQEAGEKIDADQENQENQNQIQEINANQFQNKGLQNDKDFQQNMRKEDLTQIEDQKSNFFDLSPKSMAQVPQNRDQLVRQTVQLNSNQEGRFQETFKNLTAQYGNPQGFIQNKMQQNQKEKENQNKIEKALIPQELILTNDLLLKAFINEHNLKSLE